VNPAIWRAAPSSCEDRRVRRPGAARTATEEELVTIGWGIVSTAGIADGAVAPAIAGLEGATLVGVSSRDQGRADEFAARHGARLATTSLDELLADPEVEIVYIATPNGAHAAEVKAAAAAGKHVLCEKPLATSVEDAEAAVDACREAGVKLGVNFQTRHFEPIEEVREIVASGEIGEVLVAECQNSPGRAPLGGWRTDKSLTGGLGTINNLGVHPYDTLRYVLGSEVDEVTTLLNVGRKDELETIALALLRFDNGTIAYVNANQAAHGPRNDLAIHGSEGRILARGVTRPGIADGELAVMSGGAERATKTSTTNGFARAIAAFQQAVAAGEEPSASGLDGLRSVDITEALRQSAREGRTVEVRRR
jgi:1,5-anhydro-D-fructose reductase (1,5-anhydro-D-mannitol-forming)